MKKIEFGELVPIMEFKGDVSICKKAFQELKNALKITDTSISFFDDENYNTRDVLNSANQFSFFDDRRLIILNNLILDLKKDEQQLFLEYEQKPNDKTVILILNTNGNKTFDFLKTKRIFEYKIDDSSVNEFIANGFKKRDKEIGFAEIKKLKEYCGNDLTKISLEINKICDYLNNNEKTITVEIIDKLVVADTELKVFELCDALSKKDIKKAHMMLYKMIQMGEPIVKILGLISSHFRRLFFAKINGKKSNEELARVLGCKEYAIVKAKEQASKFKAIELKNIENIILETDYNMKNGIMSQENAIYYLIFAITNKLD